MWAFSDADYYELKTRRERRVTSHGVSIRIARGLYYSPLQFRSQTHEWDETVHVDTGLLAVTTKHIYFRGSRKDSGSASTGSSPSTNSTTASG